MTAMAQETHRVSPMLYGEIWHCTNSLKNRLRNEISELRHTLAKMEQAMLNQHEAATLWADCKAATDRKVAQCQCSDEETPCCSNLQTVAIYRNMIRQRERMYSAIR